MNYQGIKAAERVFELERHNKFCNDTNNRILQQRKTQFRDSYGIIDPILETTITLIKEEISDHTSKILQATCTEGCIKKLNNRILAIYDLICYRVNRCSFSQTCSDFLQRKPIHLPNYVSEDITNIIPAPICDNIFVRLGRTSYNRNTTLQIVSSLKPGKTCTCEHCTHSPFGKQHSFLQD